MPFFSEAWTKSCNKMKKNVTLQVRMPMKTSRCLGKRVFSSVSVRFKASMSVEAAFALSLFLFFMISLSSPMKLMNIHRQMQAALESVGEDAARYAYVTSALGKGEDDLQNEEQWKSEYTASFKDKAAILAYGTYELSRRFSGGPVEGLNLMRSKVMEDDDDIDLVVQYRVRLPFAVFGVQSVPQMCRCRRRAWTGRDGGSGSGENGSGREDEIVYIGKNSTRYHRDRYCHYLYNHLSSVSRDEVENIRNQGGGKYHACSVCGGNKDGNTVYVMPYGDKYHTDPECSSIISYVQAVKLSEVEYLGGCSYCSGGK